jgi:hypothetical protein
MMLTVLTVYRNDIPVARAQWAARYETSTPDALRSVMDRLADRYAGGDYRWYVSLICH